MTSVEVLDTVTKTALSRRAAWAEGQPISQLMAQALAQPDLISLAAGFVDQQSLPVETTRTALEALLRDTNAGQAALQYGTTHGYPPLRRLLLDKFILPDYAGHDPHLSLDQVVLTAGSNQLLHLVGESLLNTDDIVICAAPTYLVFVGTLTNIGARSLGVIVDGQGMVPEALEDRLRELDAAGQLPRVKAIYLVPYFDNPCGLTMPLERRAQIVDIAKRWSRHHRIHVISDEAYRLLRYDGEDVPTTRVVDEEGDTVIVAGTFSKSYSPGIRVGWGVLPRDLVAPVCNQKGNIDFGSPNFSQHLMAKVMELGLFEPHVETIRASYREKLQAMLEAADEFLAPLDGVTWIHPTGGLYVWVRLPAYLDAGPGGPLLDLAVEEGMLYVPGQYCYPGEGEPVHANTMRLSFGVQTPERIRAGMACLARAIERARQHSSASAP